MRVLTSLLLFSLVSLSSASHVSPRGVHVSVQVDVEGDVPSHRLDWIRPVDPPVSVLPFNATDHPNQYTPPEDDPQRTPSPVFVENHDDGDHEAATDEVDLLSEDSSAPQLGAAPTAAPLTDEQKYAQLLADYKEESSLQQSQDPNFHQYVTFPTHPVVGAPVVVNKCTQKGGECRPKSGCDGQVVSGLCPGATFCCVSPSNTPSVFQSDDPQCAYNGQVQMVMTGNNNVPVTAVKIIREHLTDPSSFDLPSDASDNTVSTSMACAWDAMRRAALADGIHLTISSGFRTLKRQNYFYHCYKTHSCNHGNLAALPGTSNHGLGKALDLNCADGNSAEYHWMKKHAFQFKFVRAVVTEHWHWEYKPEAKSPASYT